MLLWSPRPAPFGPRGWKALVRDDECDRASVRYERTKHGSSREPFIQRLFGGRGAGRSHDATRRMRSDRRRSTRSVATIHNTNAANEMIGAQSPRMVSTPTEHIATESQVDLGEAAGPTLSRVADAGPPPPSASPDRRALDAHSC